MVQVIQESVVLFFSNPPCSEDKRQTSQWMGGSMVGKPGAPFNFYYLIQIQGGVYDTGYIMLCKQHIYT